MFFRKKERAELLIKKRLRSREKEKKESRFLKIRAETLLKTP